MTTQEDRPNVGRGGAPTANQWSVPRLSIDADGDWFDDGVEITHPGILANLRSGLQHDAQGFFIQTRVRIPVDVADAPFVVVRFERRGEGFAVVLNDGTDEVVDPATLRIGPGDIPYCAVKAGRFEARFSRAAAHQLLGLAEYDESRGRGVLRSGRREYSLRRSG